MSFQEESGSLFSRMHVSSAPRPAVVGAAVLVVVLVVAMAGGLVPLLGGGAFTVKAGEEAAEQVVGESASADGVGDGAAASGAGEGAREDGAQRGADAATAPEVSARICVHVDGAVEAPGVYSLDAGARVADAVQAAGGLSGDAYSAAINLAQVLVDGQQIIVPTEEDVTHGFVAGAGSSSASGGVAGGSAASGATGSPSGGASAASGKVNINTASAAELITLSGIGEATAAKIIAYREANGRFAAIEDIKLVSGIGEKKFEALRDFICV